MTTRLSFWIAVAFALVAAMAIVAVGLQWTTAIALLHVPAVLATLLLGRAAWCALRGRSWALRAGEREVLGGVAGFVAPLLFLVAWTAARETGVVGARLTATAVNHTRTTHTSAWRTDEAQPPLPKPGLVVHAPDGALGDAFVEGLQGRWPATLATLHGEVTLTCESPSAWWPLYKSAAFTCKIEGLLQLHSVDASTPVRSSTMTMEVESSWRMIGLASNRDFQQWLGSEVAVWVRKAIDGHVQKADKK